MVTILFATTGNDEEHHQKEAQIAASKVREDVGSSDNDVDQHQRECPKLNYQRHGVINSDLEIRGRILRRVTLIVGHLGHLVHWFHHRGDPLVTETNSSTLSLTESEDAERVAAQSQ